MKLVLGGVCGFCDFGNVGESTAAFANITRRNDGAWRKSGVFWRGWVPGIDGRARRRVRMGKVSVVQLLDHLRHAGGVTGDV